MLASMSVLVEQLCLSSGDRILALLVPLFVGLMMSVRT